MFQDFVAALVSGHHADKLITFYRDSMGLPIMPERSVKEGKYTLFSAGKSGCICVVQSSLPIPCGPTALWIEADDVDNTYFILRSQHHVPLLVDLTDTYYGAREFQALDPEGNIICIINYQEDLCQRKHKKEKKLYGDEFRVVLYVKNLGACYRFYTQVLGLSCVYRWEENRGDRGFKYALCAHGNAYIETLFREPLALQRQETVVLRTHDLEHCFRSVRALAPGNIAFPIRTVGGTPIFGVWDPEGNLILILGG